MFTKIPLCRAGASGFLYLLRGRADYRLHGTLDDAGRRTDDRAADDRSAGFLREGAHLERMADRSRVAHRCGARGHLDAQHVAGRALRWRVFNLVLETVDFTDPARSHRIGAAGKSVQPARARAFGSVASPRPNRFECAPRRTASHWLGDDQGASLARYRAGTGLASVSGLYPAGHAKPAPHRILRPLGKRLPAIRGRTRRAHRTGIAMDDRLGVVRFPARSPPLAAECRSALDLARSRGRNYCRAGERLLLVEPEQQRSARDVSGGD